MHRLVDRLVGSWLISAQISGKLVDVNGCWPFRRLLYSGKVASSGKVAPSGKTVPYNSCWLIVNSC